MLHKLALHEIHSPLQMKIAFSAAAAAEKNNTTISQHDITIMLRDATKLRDQLHTFFQISCGLKRIVFVYQP
jgi:hypothetical protein